MAQPASEEQQAAAPAPKSESHANTPAASAMSHEMTPASSIAAVSSSSPAAVSDEKARLPSPAVADRRASSRDLTPPASNAIVAHDAPQTAQTSASDPRPAKSTSQNDTLDAAMNETSYGTRSRNRNNARPNYAEDQDMDFEFVSAATTTTATKKKVADASAPVESAASDSKVAPDSTAFQAANSSVAYGAKESTPASSGLPAGTSTKKRKAAGTSAAASQGQAVSTNSPHGARKSNSAASSNAMRETNVMTFYKHRSCLNKKGELVADDGTKLAVNDHVYLVCEPPGDPYYVCRIMEFLHVDSDNPSSPVDSLRVNWYYRPRDVQRFSTDTRLVYGTMHSDMCPMTSLRGKCTIKHRSEIEDLDAYRKERDSFYFVQVFDRFIRRSYECIPVRQIINVPDKVKKALDERWKFVVVETGRVKELTSAAKTCKRCARYCATDDSVDCAICKNSYHMNCVQPPLPKKPSRGFAWACGPCSRASEKKKEARSTSASGNVTEVEEEDVVEEEEPTGISNDTTRAPSPNVEDMVIDDHPATQAEIALAKMWPMRYLGIHARVEDALQYDDRAIYPRASSRLGPRHQANVNIWHGRPVELIKPAEIKKRFNKGTSGKKEGKLTKETLAALEADRDEKAKRPKWVQDEPQGYVARGEDYDSKDPRCTAKLLFDMPSVEEHPAAATSREEDVVVRQENFVDNYIQRAKGLARAIGVPPFGTNFLDKALELLTTNKYNVDAALKQLQRVDRRTDLHEPVLSKSDLIKFEEGVAKFGSEHRLIRLHMKTSLPYSEIVRFYYLWKKTPKGREIWGNYGGRKKRKMESDAGARLQAEVANDADDSAFDNEKAARKNRGFQCKFCNIQHSAQWKRAPGVSPGQAASPDKNAPKDKKDRPLLALCLRCAGLWRKYAIQWEEIDEVAKKVATGGGRGMKRKIDEELLRELIAANEAASMQTPDHGSNPVTDGREPPTKKSKTEKDRYQAIAAAPIKKEKPPPPPRERTPPPPPPIIPAQPTWKTLPCAVCKGLDNTIACAHCALTVHRRCFGLRADEGVRANGDVKWICEQCQNDRNPMVSTDYSCCLCLTEETLVELVEPPKVSHKKKTDREREKERLEKELADGMRAEYRGKQLARNRPQMPREPLKRTAGNNWVHVYCAVWAPEIRFSNAKALEVAEGVQLIPQPRFEAICKLCKNKDRLNSFREHAGACVNCLQCNANFHASCAFEAGYIFGFDVQPVKGSRKDQITTATLGQETGALTAVILCKEHAFKGVIHPMDEIVDENGSTALQVYVENYKQADLALTGTVRKAAQAQLTKDKIQQSPASALNGNRRESGAHSIATAVRRGARTSLASSRIEGEDGMIETSSVSDSTESRCVKCNVDVTPKWHPVVTGSSADRWRSPTQQISTTLSETGDTNKLRDGMIRSTPPSDRVDLSNPQSIRFAALGANGRAWEGEHERYGPRPQVNGELYSTEGIPNAHVGSAFQDATAPPHPHNQHRSVFEDLARRENDDGHHNHALPRLQNSAARPRMEIQEQELPRQYLCHKCFLQQKLAPTPPPEDSRALSPAAQIPAMLNGASRSSQPLALPTIEQQFDVWDKPPLPPMQPSMRPVPPPSTLPPPPYYGPQPGAHPPSHPYAHSPFGQQPNGFHGLPPPHVGPAAVHERHHSYSYQPQPSPNPPPHYPPPAQPISSLRNGYPAQSHPVANGLPSPHIAPPQHSPTYPYDPALQRQQQQQQQGHQQMHASRSDQPVQQAVQLHPIFEQPRPALQPFGPPRAQPINGQPPHHAPQPQGVSPQTSHAGLDGPVPRPSTPRGGSSNGAVNSSGASASPNLMNLIH